MLENKDSEMADSDNFKSMDFDLRIDDPEGDDSDAQASPLDHRLHPAEMAELNQLEILNQFEVTDNHEMLKIKRAKRDLQEQIEEKLGE